jgi:hypothetical protein
MEGSFMKYHIGFFAALCAVTVTCAQAQSSANARFDLTVENASGFAWVTDPESYTTTDASAASLTGWVPSAGVFSAVYSPTLQNNQTAIGQAIPPTSISAGTSPVVASGSSVGNASGSINQFLVRAEATQGRAEATSFARSYFTLDAGATVTFNGSLLLSMLGTNADQPANYNTNDFYSFAAGFMAVGADTFASELGGPNTTGLVGNYSLSDWANWSLTVINTESTQRLTYLESGITVSTANAISAVPEPGAYLLSLAGMLAVGFKLRGRNKSR